MIWYIYYPLLLAGFLLLALALWNMMNTDYDSEMCWGAGAKDYSNYDSGCTMLNIKELFICFLEFIFPGVNVRGFFTVCPKFHKSENVNTYFI